MSRAGLTIAALFMAEQALSPALDIVKRRHDREYRHVRRRPAQPESPADAARGSQNPGLGKLMEDLGEVVLGHAEIRRNLSHAGQCPSLRRDIQCGAERIFSSLRKHFSFHVRVTASDDADT
jgi:hypothetical protein